MASYAFLSTWLLRAPREEVWGVVEDVTSWPDWWRGVVAAEELDGGDGDRVGSRYRVRWRSWVPYAIGFEFEVDEVRRPGYMRGRARGDLEGTGTWRLFEEDGVTAVTYEWQVRTGKAWMNAVAPVARPVFERNHDWVMARGGEGLARELGVPLIGAG